MSYTKGKLKTVKPTTGNPEIDNYWLDIVSDKGVNIATAYIDDAKRIVHCVNNYDGLVEACKKTIILISGEHFKYNDTITLGHIEILQMLKDRLEQAIAKAEEE